MAFKARREFIEEVIQLLNGLLDRKAKADITLLLRFHEHAREMRGSVHQVRLHDPKGLL